MTTPVEEINRAFGHGSDARLLGLSPSYNPYNIRKALGDTLLWQYWLMGWRHVNSSWNVDNKRYPARSLPPVLQLTI